MPDVSLQSRAGSNVGNEPAASLHFIAKSHSKSVDVPTTGATIELWAGEGEVLRVPFAPGANLGAILMNKSATLTYDWTLTFIDDEGNELEMTTGSIAPGDTGEVNADGPFQDGLFAICAGESIVLSAVEAV